MIRLRFFVYGAVVVLLLPILMSCGSTKNIWYFQDIEKVANSYYQDNTNAEPRIVPNDNLYITVATTNLLAAEPYNNVSRNGGAWGNMEWQGYLVDAKGEINFPGVGKVHAAGLTRYELVNVLQTKLLLFIDNPVVNVRIMNYSIAILGAVNRPGIYQVASERISIPEALAMAGDLTIYGQRRDILICRVENGEKQFYHIDLTSPDIFFSDVYYLRQRDIVYVKMNKAGASAASMNPWTGTWFSVIGALISTVTLLASLGAFKKN